MKNKVKHSFMIKKKKIPSKLGVKRNFFNLIKTIYKKKKKTTANIILNGEKLDTFPPR